MDYPTSPAGVSLQHCNVAPLNFIASGDLSDSQYYAMVLNGEKTVLAAGSNVASILGILQNTPEDGEPASVMCVPGIITKGISGDVIALTAGKCLLKTDSSGRFVTASAGSDKVVAIGLSTADAADEQIEIMLLPTGAYSL